MTRTVWHVYRAARAERADVYHFHDPELIPVGLLLKLRGAQVVYDVHEDRPRQMMSKYWIPLRLRGSVARLVHAAEWASGRVWDGIVAATPAIGRLFPGDKTVVVQNFPMLDELTPTDAIPYAARPPIIAYVGNLTTIRGAREMVAAMDLLPAGLHPRLHLAGAFDPPALEDELRSLPGWTRVTFSRLAVTAGGCRAHGTRQSGTRPLAPDRQLCGGATEQALRVHVRGHSGGGV